MCLCNYTIKFFLLLVSCYLLEIKCDLTVQYYEKLINQSKTNATTFQLPTDNSEFQKGLESEKINDFGCFDFIIVGAGTAGSVLATRLSEISEFRILLLEAGGEENDFNNIPGMFLYYQFDRFNWGYYSTPQKTCCLGMNDNKCIIPRGKSIGGSSAINGMMYVRGNPRDFDEWERLGNTGWSYKDVLRYFTKSENSQIEGDEGYHGKGGFLNVEYSEPNSELFKNFVDGNAELNTPYLDYNGRSQFGVSKMQYTIKRGRRQSTGSAFLDNARKRKNLTVLTKAFVTKINIDPVTKTAQGVEFVRHDIKHKATAIKEVILSAGAINSPQILMLSGIGPKCDLEKLGIKVVADLAGVGCNLFEHPVFTGFNIRTNFTRASTSMKENIIQYLNGLGSLTSPENFEGISFLRTNRCSNVPTIEYLLAPASDSGKILSRSLNFKADILTNYLGQINPTTTFSVYMVLLHSKSSGKVTLKSKNPIDFPNIDLNMFAMSEDIDTMRAGIENGLKLLQTKTFKKINASLIDIPICKQFEKYSNKFWECVIRSLTATIYHPCGTTAMGPKEKAKVVDSNLNVHGIKKLRVVDAGIFPSTISGHLNAAVVMIAEKISDVIKTCYGKNILKRYH